MPPPSSPPVLDKVLRTVPRRYRLPVMPVVSGGMEKASPSLMLASVIEQARQAVVRGEVPDAALKHLFIEALARLIQEAMGSDMPTFAEQRAVGGDPVFQAMVLRHRSAQVREYASLSARADQDRRTVHAIVNAVAHPGKQQKIPPGWQRDAMAQLHASAFSFLPASTPTFISTSAFRPTPKFTSPSLTSWSRLAETARRLLAMPQVANDPLFERGLQHLLDSSELERLQRFESLTSNKAVCQYQALCDRQGPRSGSAGAVAQGAASQQRGAAVEALATQALKALARRLNQESRQEYAQEEEQGGGLDVDQKKVPDKAQGEDQEGARKEGNTVHYCVVTSMRVPASIPGSAERAKSEWDAVLLRRADTIGATPAYVGETPVCAGTTPAYVETTPVWDVCLFVEAKASVDAATTDLPRLLRGLRLLAHAEENAVYPFETRQGTMQLRGASLRAITTDEASLKKTVLYCCDAPAETTPRWFSAASRMLLLSEQASVEFAGKLADKQDADARGLDPVWQQLLESPRWRAVLHQYPMLHQVRELMIHPEDLLTAINGMASS